MQLQKARNLLQIKPIEAAQQLHVAVKDIEDWEEENSQPSLKQLEALARFYGSQLDKALSIFFRELDSG